MELIDRLRERGWRLTSQRRVIAQVLSGPSLHPTADEVLALARETLPEISVATVYNTLNELVELGELSEIDGFGRSRRYDPTATSPHHHLVCTGCDRIIDIFPAPASTPALPPSDRHGFVDLEADVIYRGRCPDCAAS